MIDTFFDKNLFQQIFSGLIVAIIGGMLLGNKETSKITTSKFWKGVIIASWVIIIGGLYVSANNAQNGGISNAYVLSGIGFIFLGIIINFVGRFFIWWQ